MRIETHVIHQNVFWIRYSFQKCFESVTNTYNHYFTKVFIQLLTPGSLLGSESSSSLKRWSEDSEWNFLSPNIFLFIISCSRSLLLTSGSDIVAGYFMHSFNWNLMLFVLLTISKFISKFNLFLSQSHRSSLATHGSASNLYINLRDFDCKWIKLFVITYQQETYIYNKGVICLLHDFLENERDRYVYRYHRIMSYMDNLRLNFCWSSVHMHLWVTFVLPRRLRFLTNTKIFFDIEIDSKTWFSFKTASAQMTALYG